MSYNLAMVMGEGKPYEKTQCRRCFSDNATKSSTDHNNAFLYICKGCNSKYELSLGILEKYQLRDQRLSEFLNAVLAEPVPLGKHIIFWLSASGQEEYRYS